MNAILELEGLGIYILGDREVAFCFHFLLELMFMLRILPAIVGGPGKRG